MKTTHSSFYRLVSVILALTLLIACVPISVAQAAEDANYQQIEYTGGWNPVGYESDGTLYKDRVAVSKTVAPTEKENYFDITLKVVAKPRVIDQSVDVVLVMDNSNTMNATHEGLGSGNAGYDIADARLTHAKNAVNTFLDMYSVDSNISEDRGFGLVTFNSYAKTIVPITTVNTEQKATEIKTIVNGITAPTGNRERFTNIEGGLQLAYNLLKNSDAAFKYIIFITDGFPTTYIESGRNSTTQIVGYDTYMSGSYNASKVGTDGYFADSITKKLCLYGVNYSDKGADRADDVAAQIKTAGINIFSIGIDVGVQSIPDYLSYAKNTSHTTVDRRANTFVIGSTTESYKAWLRDSIAGGPMIEKAESTEDIHRYASGNSATQLNTAFTNILRDIELIPAETMEEAYTLDPMSDSVEFLYFYDFEGNPAHKVTNTKNGKEVAVYSDDNETIKWWLTTTENWYVDEIGNYVLSLTYRVRLKNEAEGFEFGKALVTNDPTTFFFKTVDFSTGEALFGDNSIDYPIPEVEGYYGDLYFTKQDAVTSHPLEGAEFTLQHYEDSCNVCGGDAVIADMYANSDESGKVKFENIPSGHEYVLMETKAPEGYRRGAHHSVNVAYGKTYVDGVQVTEDAPGVIKNQTLVPVEVTFTACKTLKGRELKAGEFSFILEGVFEHGNVFHEIATNDESGMVTFHEIIFDEVGTYTFYVYEEMGSDATVVYDEKIYEIEVVVTLSEDGKCYEVDTFIDGVKAENGYVPEAVKFTNTLRDSGYAQLVARKTIDGDVPEDGVFHFELKDEKGAVLQTKSSVNGEVTFDEIEYTDEGVYYYTISERHPESGDMTDVFFDHRQYTAVVTVTAPEHGGAFETQVDYFLEEDETEIPLFENKTRTPATFKFSAIKTLDMEFPAHGQFDFILEDAEGNVIAQVPNSDAGLVEFPIATFDEVGYYTYIVKEVKGSEEGIIYDKTIYEIKINVEAHHNLQSYYLEVIIEKQGVLGSVQIAEIFGSHLDISTNGYISFNNRRLGSAKVVLTANKLLDGETPGQNEMFEFVLADEQGSVLQTVANNGSEIVFEILEFSCSGEYVYRIYERAGNEDSVVYDETEYEVRINVTTPEDGEAYVAEVIVTKGNQEVKSIDFYNVTKNEVTEPVQTEPTEPEQTEPTEPVQTEPTKPEQTDPTEPEQTEPTEPEQTDPTEPEQTDPTEPEQTEPTKPEQTDPTENVSVPMDNNLTNPTATGILPPDESDATGCTDQKPTGDTPHVPNTGDNRQVVISMVVMLVCAAGVVLIGKRKHKTE